jgi:hypothetical protein
MCTLWEPAKDDGGIMSQKKKHFGILPFAVFEKSPLDPQTWFG